MDALREAIVNAIVHRNYTISGTSIYVRIYDDRVEIENPGGLPDGITKLDFAKSSVRRNPIIADMFHRMGKVERMGSGIERMRDLMREAGLKEPVFEMDAFFRVAFYRDPRYSLKADRETGEKTTQKKLGERLGDKLGERLGKNEMKILDIINQNKFITIPKLSKSLKISTTAVENNIAKLKAKKVLKRIGSDKGGHWEIVNG
ncbi:MAG: ATP-binding protein [Deltaproteobacteria bacterium]|nr:ATP-binding protein [Deltaproteobacteria bacterium]